MKKKRIGRGISLRPGRLPMDCQSHKYFASAPSGLLVTRSWIDLEILLKRDFPVGTYASFGTRRPNLDSAVAVTRPSSCTAPESSPVPFDVRP